MLHADAPGVRPELPERLDEAGDRERNLIGTNAPERVVSIWLRGIGSVEIDDSPSLVCRHGVIDPLNKIAVWVYKGEAALCFGVLKGKRFEKRRLADAGLADDVQVQK